MIIFYYYIGLFYFLGAIVNFNQEADVHLKYIQVSVDVCCGFVLFSIITGCLQDRSNERSRENLPGEQ